MGPRKASPTDPFAAPTKEYERFMQLNHADLPNTQLRYFNGEVPRDQTVKTGMGGEYSGLLTLGERPGMSKEEYKKFREQMVLMHEVTVQNARSCQPGGLSSWKFEEHALTFVKAEFCSNFHDPKVVKSEFEPRLLELAKRTTGATRAWMVGHQIRTEITGFGTSSASYARFAHSDYGPEYEPLFRRLLVGRFGFSEEEAQNCGLCCANYWAPIERPAYRDPLCLLDCTSVDLEKDTVRYIYQGELGFKNNKPLAERIPAAAQDAPAIAPVFSSRHRWVYAPDQTPEEAVIFKQYDWRPNVARRACWHTSFRDDFHKDWEDCPGRRSIECRLLLVWDKEGVPQQQESKL